MQVSFRSSFKVWWTFFLEKSHHVNWFETPCKYSKEPKKNQNDKYHVAFLFLILKLREGLNSICMYGCRLDWVMIGWCKSKIDFYVLMYTFY